MARRVSLVVLGLALLAVAFPASARVERRQFARMERVEVEPYFAGLLRVRIWVNLLQLEGALIDGVKPEELQLVAGGSRHKQIPGIGRFEYTDDLVDLVLVVNTHASFSSALEDLEEPVSKLIARLPRATTRVALVTYGDEAKATKLQEPASISRRWKRVVAEDVPEPPQLVRAIDKAIKLLAAAPPLRKGPDVRKLILIISDGNDNDVQAEETKDEFRKLSKAARTAGIVVHSIAFSFLDNRDPFLNLGELAKKSGGTFRWARNRADFAGHLDAFMNELRRQMVLTFFLPPEEVVGKNLKLLCKSPRCGESPVESNELRAPPLRCGGKECAIGNACIAGACTSVAMTGGGGRTGTWIAVVAVLLAGAGAGAVVVRRRRQSVDRKAQQKDAPGGAMASGPAQPVLPQVVMPDFSNMPYLANSSAVAQLNQQLAQMPYVAQAQQAQIAAAQAAAAAAQKPAVPSARGAQILVLSGPRSGQSFPLRHGFTVGRTPGCDLVIDDGMTSGHHAQFVLDTAGGVSVLDLGSTNGTYVNGVRATQSRLAHGMSVRIGQTDFRFLQG